MLRQGAFDARLQSIDRAFVQGQPDSLDLKRQRRLQGGAGLRAQRQAARAKAPEL